MFLEAGHQAGETPHRGGAGSPQTPGGSWGFKASPMEHGRRPPGPWDRLAASRARPPAFPLPAHCCGPAQARGPRPGDRCSAAGPKGREWSQACEAGPQGGTAGRPEGQRLGCSRQGTPHRTGLETQGQWQRVGQTPGPPVPCREGATRCRQGGHRAELAEPGTCSSSGSCCTRTGSRSGSASPSKSSHAGGHFLEQLGASRCPEPAGQAGPCSGTSALQVTGALCSPRAFPYTGP